MQKVSLIHGERRCAVNVDAKLFNVPDPQLPADAPRAPAISLAVVWPGTNVQLGEFVGAAHLHLKACESHADADVQADLPCMIRNDGPDAIMVESMGGRYRGMKYPMLAGDERVFPLSVFDEAEVLSLSVIPTLNDMAPGPDAKCERVPCDMTDGIRPRCNLGGDRRPAESLQQIQQELEAQAHNS